jgi:SAM-dependent methyltransferase
VTAKAWAGKAVNSALRPLGVQVISRRSTNPNNPAVKTFIPARETLAAARQEGLSVGDYIDKTFAELGVTAATVKAMLDLSDLQGQVSRVCEIGTGSGRYMEKVIECLHPDAYEVYETADDWLPHLRTFPTALIRPCDGRTLSSTATASVDLVHAQKVFVYLDFWATANYLDEMARVVRPGGAVAFDIVTEDCLDEAMITHSMEHGSTYRLTPRTWAIDFLTSRGLSYIGHYFPVMPPGTSEFMVFRRLNSEITEVIDQPGG